MGAIEACRDCLDMLSLLRCLCYSSFQSLIADPGGQLQPRQSRSHSTSGYTLSRRSMLAMPAMRADAHRKGNADGNTQVDFDQPMTGHPEGVGKHNPSFAGIVRILPRGEA